MTCKDRGGPSFLRGGWPKLKIGGFNAVHGFTRNSSIKSFKLQSHTHVSSSYYSITINCFLEATKFENGEKFWLL